MSFSYSCTSQKRVGGVNPDKRNADGACAVSAGFDYRLLRSLLCRVHAVQGARKTIVVGRACMTQEQERPKFCRYHRQDDRD